MSVIGSIGHPLSLALLKNAAPVKAPFRSDGKARGSSLYDLYGPALRYSSAFIHPSDWQARSDLEQARNQAACGKRRSRDADASSIDLDSADADAADHPGYQAGGGVQRVQASESQASTGDLVKLLIGHILHKLLFRPDFFLREHVSIVSFRDQRRRFFPFQVATSQLSSDSTMQSY